MKQQDVRFLSVSTVLAFILIPLGGLTTDIYLPSLPAMAEELKVAVPAVQATLVFFMISSGVSQLLLGSILDSFGRYKLSMIALVVFTLASITIARSGDIRIIYAMRVLQGLAVSMVIVGKRAFFADVYTGDKLKRYTSLFSIVWAMAPIVAPFIGGYIQLSVGWQGNFYLLALLTTCLLIMEWRFTGESLKTFQRFEFRSILAVYKDLLGTADFSLALLIAGLSYSLLVIYGMASPFIIEQIYGYTPVTTGYSSLASGIALMLGGIVSKWLNRRPLFSRLNVAVGIQLLLALAMTLVILYTDRLIVLLLFTLPVHFMAGFLFNSLYAYSLQRFNHHAGTVSGLTGGSIYVVSAVVGYGLIHLFDIRTGLQLACVNLLLVCLLLLTMLSFKYAARRGLVPAALLVPENS